MKKLLLSFFLLSGSLFFVSCGDDEEEEQLQPPLGLSGTVSYDGGSFSVVDGRLSDVQVSNNIASRTFYLTDGTFTVSGSNVSASGSQIVIVLTAAATGATSIEAGVYDSNSDINGRQVDVQVTTSSGTQDAFTDGTIDISGSGNTYTLIFDVPFRGTRLTGSVSGTYESL